MQGSSPSNIVKLTPPTRPTRENIIGYNFGMRPYRKGGVRLEREAYKNKIFYHNYGHGGGGVSLGYGTSRYTVDLFTSNTANPQSKEVAVIGSGYMGLFEAIFLADLGCKVTIYANAFPKPTLGMYDTEACITSQVAGGLWMPFGIDLHDKPLSFALAKETYDFYAKCIKEGKYKGLSYKPVYVIEGDNPLGEYCPPGMIDHSFVQVDFGNGKLHEAMHYTSILMDGDLFLNELYEEAKKKGINFVKRKFENIQDLCDLKETHIFNCTGLYSRILFNDKSMMPIAGHLLYLKKTPGVDYFLESTCKDGKNVVKTYPHHNKLCIGYSFEEGRFLDKPDPEIIKRLIANLNEFLEWRAGLVEQKPRLRPRL